MTLLLQETFQLGSGGPVAPVRGSRALQRVRIIAVAFILATIVMVLPPRSTIGVGKYEGRLKRQRAWIKFVSVVLPTVLLMSLVAEPILG
jgi:hypothetical protein